MNSAIADGTVDFNRRMAAIQLRVKNKELAEFKSTTQKPERPLSVRVLSPAGTRRPPRKPTDLAGINRLPAQPPDRRFTRSRYPLTARHGKRSPLD